jgi:FixJ family two-component response regulator
MNMQYTCLARGPSAPAEAATVFIVDGDAPTRTTLEALVRSAGWRARTVSSAQQFLALPRATTPHCLLVDLDLPDLSGLELQKRVVDRTEMPIVFMSGHADVRATVQAMKAGAFEFLTKPFDRDLLLQTIRQAFEHSGAALRQLTRTLALRQRYESLSRREREVMGLVIAGRLNKQVGGELGISEITVKAHRGKMMRKMQAGSVPELVTMAVSLQQRAPANLPHFDFRDAGSYAGDSVAHAWLTRASAPATARAWLVRL